MDWVKLAQDYYLDPAIRGLPGDLADAAEVMFIRGLARAGRVGQSGFIPEQDVPLLARRRRYEGVVRVLTESGLWQAVPGGYQVRRWADWQDHLDALTRKRTADRERQRARRAAARNGSTEHRQPPNTSRDNSRDVTAVEGEGERDLGGRPTYVGHQSVHNREPPPVDNHAREPPRRCRAHLHDPDPPNCGKCADARRQHQAWEADQARTRAGRDRAGPKCRIHRGQPAGNCAGCRADQLATKESP